jgi:hypothetical protein
MELLHAKTTGLILLLGSVLFMIAAFLPYSRIFAESDPTIRLEILDQQRKMWSFGQVLFALGSVITVFGLAYLYFRYRESIPGLWAWISILALLAGSILWSWHCVERLISPEGFVNGTLTPGLFLVYSLFTQAGLILFGILLLGTDLASWTGWMLILGMALLSVLMIIFKDMPPFVYYVFTLILAIKLLTGSGSVTVS